MATTTTTTTTTATTTNNHTNQPLHFRVATPTDAARLYPLVQSAYRGNESRLGWTNEADLLAGDRISVEGILAKITHPEGAVLLATATTAHTSSSAANGAAAEEGEEEEVLIACCEVLRRTPETAYFGMFAVSPRRQGGGVGKQVLAHAEEHCKRLIAWYLRRGYRRTGEEVAFPYADLARTGGVALREDLHMVILAKDLR
ncbi:uncharacterized protein B0T15DRAFT_513890 [Chaetomium strumarium]|uniref:N-acetyltransferase domain-containing protein n=1 Tax=Chaetomium strumarium TaxID=1170767 RepID=A0AAJ0LZT3_9PEZI|nr:hypothetical protein B0T15DRAFT_513890 [Chaetomium strumarium]